MANNIYALLVGIDKYAPDSVIQIPSLQGCVNDIKAMEDYLRNQIFGRWTLKEPIVLKNQDATRQAIIDGFQNYLYQADSEDIALFYYSGHGGQEKAPEELWRIEPDRYNETLVCYDGFIKGNYHLADKEIRYLLYKLAKNNPHVVVILDCCHSGSGTRNIPEGVRLAPRNQYPRPWSSFIFDGDKNFIKNLANTAVDIGNKKIGLDLPEGRHILLAACRDYQYANEYRGDEDKMRGIFSDTLFKVLQQTNRKLSYQDLVRSLAALISTKVKDQVPQLEATNLEELKTSFLGEAVPERPPYFNLSYNTITGNLGWEIDGGMIHGIIKKSSTDLNQTTYLAVFPAGSTSARLRELPLCEAKVTKVLTGKSSVEILYRSEQNLLSENENYWAFVTSVPLDKLRVYIKNNPGNEVGILLAQEAIKTANNAQSSLYVTQVDNPDDADFNLVVDSGQYWITQKYNNLPVIAPIPEQPNSSKYIEADAEKTIKALEAIARWNNILKLRSQGSTIDPNQVDMEIVLVGHGNSPDDFIPYEAKSTDKLLSVDSGLYLEYIYDNDQWKPPVIQVKLTNKTDNDLYCNILLLSEDYSVHRYGEKTYVLRVEDGAINRSRETEFESLVIPNKFLQNGITEYKDIFKLIVSTTDFNADLLEQNGLEPPFLLQRSSPKGTLEYLMQQIDTRNAGAFGTKYDNWITKEVALTIVRPQDTEHIQSDKSVKLLNGLVEVQPHPYLQAKVTLSTVSQTIRHIGDITVPPVLCDEQGVIESFEFTTSRGSDPGLSVLELLFDERNCDVNSVASVTKDAPIRLVINKDLEDDEYVLPISYDGEFFLPLGQGVRTEEGKTQITLNRLPKPTTSSRSLGGSIKIFFKKLRSQKLGHSYEYPILAAAEVNKQGKVKYEKDIEEVKKRVAKAQKIILYIHGIIGDTESMVGSIQHQVKVNGQFSSLQELYGYDLVLTFDYENLHTTIEKNALLLKQRLKSVGLGADHGKELHIVAHSMGGLVSRWFIEQERGNQVVKHLVMLGTPNAGSPWPVVQETIFSFARFLNEELGEIVLPARVLAKLIDKFLEFVEANDNALDQMQPDSRFLSLLVNNPDPCIPYTIIAGDRSLAHSPEQSNRLRRLMKTLFEPTVNRVIDDFVFGQEPNDIAVSLTSINSISTSRSPQPIILPPIACDHLTYFTTEAGLKALSSALNSSF